MWGILVGLMKMETQQEIRLVPERGIIRIQRINDGKLLYKQPLYSQGLQREYSSSREDLRAIETRWVGFKPT